MAPDPDPQAERADTADTGDAADRAERPVFLYDGDCAFCTSCAHFIERRIPTSAEVSPWQFADLDLLGVTQAQAEEAVLWIAEGEPVAAGPDAIARLLEESKSAWKGLGWFLGREPVGWVAWPMYRWVSKNRHRMPGGTAECSLPQSQRKPRHSH
jgi:predicted DCC family thiol-disulfide oxidoreductase YuxK